MDINQEIKLPDPPEPEILFEGLFNNVWFNSKSDFEKEYIQMKDGRWRKRRKSEKIENITEDINDYIKQYDLKHASCSKCKYLNQYDAWSQCKITNKEGWFRFKARWCKWYTPRYRSV